MTGGDPPLPPSRTPHSWQGRPYRRRGAPPSSRAPWSNRRLRSPPPPSIRPRYPRAPPPHKHHRHVPPPHPSPQPSYHHHHTPPLSRNLQARLRSPPRSPPIRRPDHPPHRPENHRADQHRPPDRVPERPQDRSADQPPYRGEPGPSHRVDNSDVPAYRPSDRSGDAFPLRGPPPKPRPDLPSYRSEHPIQRPPPDHHIPYRGEPGPLYRADNSSYRDEMDRRGVTDGVSGRGDQYNAWFRNPSKIHKPGKKKIRRYPPHMSGAGRSAQLSKPDSPILSRIGYHSMDRGVSRHDIGSAPLPRSGPMAPMGKMGGEGASRYGGLSPMVYERDALRRMENGVRLPNVSSTGGSMSNRSDAETTAHHGKGVIADSCGATLGHAMDRSAKGASTSTSDTRIPTGGPGSRRASTPSCIGKSPAELSERQNGYLKNVSEEPKPESPKKPKNELTPSGEKSIAAVGRSAGNPLSGSACVPQQQADAVARSIASEGRGKPVSAREVNDLRIKPNLSTTIITQSKGTPLSGRNEHILHDLVNEAHGKAMRSQKSSGENKDAQRFSRKQTEGAIPKGPGREGHVNRTSTPSRQTPPRPIPAKRERAENHLVQIGDTEKLRSGSTSGEEQGTFPPATPEVKLPTKAGLEQRRSPVSKSSHGNVASRDVESRVLGKGSLRRPITNQTTQLSGPGKIATAGDNASAQLAEPNRTTCIRQMPGSIPPLIPSIIPNGGAPEVVDRERAGLAVCSPSIKLKEGNDISKEVAVSMDKSPRQEKVKENTMILGAAPSTRLNGNCERTPDAPVLPVVELRSALSSKGGHPISVIQKGQKANLPIPGLRFAMKSCASAQPSGCAEPTMPVTPKIDEGLHHPSRRKEDVRSTPVPRSPVSVPAPAICFLRSSPRARSRSSSVVRPEPMQTSAEVPVGNVTRVSGSASDEQNKLVSQIHIVDEQIRALRRQLTQKRSIKPNDVSTAGSGRGESEKGTQSVKDAQMEKIKAMARAIAEREEVADDTTIPPDPSYSIFRLLENRNKSVAAASHALLRPLCHDAEKGLTKGPAASCDMLRPLSDDRRRMIATEIARRKAEDAERRRQRRKEYKMLREAWERKLKLARDKRSKEKREMMKERDRFLVMCTKGQSALLSSRTSSGRMSTKIFPSLNANGQTNANAEVDALLATIAAEGGTPGLKDIWSKTLADIPAQNPLCVPCDSGSVWIEDPLQDFQASRAVNPWRFEEKLIFLDKFAMYPKNFRKIAGFLKHKSTQDCSAYYYQHKLDLGLKQLAKEASTMKRKGILKSHIVNLARKRPSHDPEPVVTAVITAFLSSSHGSTGTSNIERPPSGGDSPTERKTNGVQKGELTNDRRKPPTASTYFKKRIISDFCTLDLSGITREAFLSAFAVHGQSWHLILQQLGLPDKSSSHYREFYKRNKRRLRLSDRDKVALKSGPAKCPAPALRQSPVASPKISPKSQAVSSDERVGPATEPEPMILETRADANSGSKESMETSSPKELSPIPASSPGSCSPMDVDGNTVSGHSQAGHRSSSKTTTWTPEERERFKQLFKKHKRDWKKIAHLMPPKTPAQVKGYWRKIAHEVGNGFPADSGKISKSERKRSKRAQSGDISGIIEEKRRIERKSTPEISTPTEAGRNRNEDGNEEQTRDSAKKTLLKTPEVHASMVQRLAQLVARRTSEGEFVSKRNGTENNHRGKDSIPEPKPSSDTVLGSETAGSSDSLGGKIADGRVAMNGKAPSLRSAPVPMLRSMPVKETQGGILSSSGGGKRIEGDSRKEGDGDGSKQNRLLRAAESYGVLELLDGARGDRLERGTR